jgi:hypothetical protein
VIPKHSTAAGPRMAAGPSSGQLPAQELAIDRSVHRSGIVPTLQNIVATVNLNCKLDLKTIAQKARNAEYNPKVDSPLSKNHTLFIVEEHGSLQIEVIILESLHNVPFLERLA